MDEITGFVQKLLTAGKQLILFALAAFAVGCRKLLLDHIETTVEFYKDWRKQTEQKQIGATLDPEEFCVFLSALRKMVLEAHRDSEPPSTSAADPPPPPAPATSLPPPLQLEAAALRPEAEPPGGWARGV